MSDGGVYRLDVEPGEARVAVLDGEATVGTLAAACAWAAGRRCSCARARWPPAPTASTPTRPTTRSRAGMRISSVSAYADGGREEWLPEEVSPYASQFDTYGTWRSEPEYGYVWYPRVATGWRPYTQGSWAWTPYGWTWVPNERWGWGPPSTTAAGAAPTWAGTGSQVGRGDRPGVVDRQRLCRLGAAGPG